MDKKKIPVLFISYDGMTDPLGQSQVIPYLEGLSKAGYAVVLLSCEKKERLQKNEAFIKKKLSDSNIEWQYVLYNSKIPGLSFLYTFLSLRHKAFLLHHRYQFQLIHCRSYIPVIIGLQLKRRFGVSVLFDMRGFWIDERVDGGLWNLKNPVFRLVYFLFKKSERSFLIKSDAIISLTEAGVTEMNSWKLPVDLSNKITVIPCCADFSLYRKSAPEAIARTRENLGIDKEAFVLLYLGAIGTWYMTDQMLDFFKVLLKRNSKAVFLILSAESEEKIRKIAKDRGVEADKIVVRYVSKEAVAEFSSAADWSIFFIKPAFSKIASSPTKLGELLSMEIPVICNSIGDVPTILNDTKGGILINAFEENSYEKEIDTMSAFAASYDAKRVRAKAQEYYDLNRAVELYKMVYKKVLNT